MKYIIIVSLLMLMIGCGQGQVSISYEESQELSETHEIELDGVKCLMVSTGLDVNQNSALELSEVQNVVSVCDDDNTPIDGDVVSIIDPCGDFPDYQDDIVLILNDGTHLALFKDVGLVELIPNMEYTTTDKQKCKFSI